MHDIVLCRRESCRVSSYLEGSVAEFLVNLEGVLLGFFCRRGCYRFSPYEQYRRECCKVFFVNLEGVLQRFLFCRRGCCRVSPYVQ